MEEQKYYLEIAKKVGLKAPIIISVVIAAIFLILGLIVFVLGNKSGIISFVFLAFFVIVIGIILSVVLGQGMSRLSYLQLKDSFLIYHHGFPHSNIEYSKIKSIKFYDGKLSNIDTDVLTPWPIYSKVENSKQFMKELRQKYKRATGKNLISFQE